MLEATRDNNAMAEVITTMFKRVNSASREFLKILLLHWSHVGIRVGFVRKTRGV